MADLRGLPPGYMVCTWCQHGIRLVDGAPPARCPQCSLHPQPQAVDPTVGGKVDPKQARQAARNRNQAPRQRPFNPDRLGQPVVGIDPGERYTGVVLRDGDVVLHATTLVRDLQMTDPGQWALHVVDAVKVLMFTEFPANTKVAVEAVSKPKGFKNGQRAPIDPGPIVMAAVVFGAVIATWPDAVRVPPGGNGSQHITHYPPELVRQRPKDLPGSTNRAGTRDHEQSAFDVAGKAAAILFPPPRRIASFA